MKNKIKSAMTLALIGAMVTIHALDLGQIGSGQCESGAQQIASVELERRYESNLDGPLVAFMMPASWSEP